MQNAMCHFRYKWSNASFQNDDRLTCLEEHFIINCLDLPLCFEIILPLISGSTIHDLLRL